MFTFIYMRTLTETESERPRRPQHPEGSNPEAPGALSLRDGSSRRFKRSKRPNQSAPTAKRSHPKAPDLRGDRNDQRDKTWVM